MSGRSAADSAAAAREWRENWKLVLATFTGFSFLSLMTGSLSVFMLPLSEEFGWSRTIVASGFSIASVVTALLSPPIGVAVDRWGSRRIGLPGILATALMIASFGFASGVQWQWSAMWLAYAVISITVKTTVWTSAVTGVFRAGQGLALGITFCGTAVAQAVLPPLATWLIETQGWRAAYAWLGLGWGAVTFIVCFLFLHDAHARRRAAVLADPAGNAAQAARPDFPGLTIAEAWRSWTLWRIAIATFLMMALTMGLTIHQIVILTDLGITPMRAALLGSLAAGAGIFGKLITGVLLDRYRGNWVGGLTLGASTFAFLLLIDGIASPTMVVIAMIFNGYTQGAKLQINGYLTARHAGQKNFGAIYGFMNAVVAGGSALGPIIAGLAYDFAGDYGAFLIAGAVVSVVCGLLIISLPGYPQWQDDPAPAPA